MSGVRASSVSLVELRRRHLTQRVPLPMGLLVSLEADSRQGARRLAQELKRQQEVDRAEEQRLQQMLKFEKELWEQGYEHIAGVDEAGVGPCAGPVCAGAAILPKGYTLKGLDDSKKIGGELRREELAATIKANAVAWAVGWAEVEEIDTLNIYQAGLLAMRRAVNALSLRPTFLLVDARKIPELEQPQRGIIKGDAQSLSIAAGAIIAKTTRDRLMNELDGAHPGYGFASHKGYPTPEHLEAMKRLGVLKFHRRSFAPVRKALGLEPEQRELF